MSQSQLAWRDLRAEVERCDLAPSAFVIGDTDLAWPAMVDELRKRVAAQSSKHPVTDRARLLRAAYLIESYVLRHHPTDEGHELDERLYGELADYCCETDHEPDESSFLHVGIAARRWEQQLRRFQNHPDLIGIDQCLDEELEALLFDVDGNQLPIGRGRDISEGRSLRFVETFLLPRFDLKRVWRLLPQSESKVGLLLIGLGVLACAAFATEVALHATVWAGEAANHPASFLRNQYWFMPTAVGGVYAGIVALALRSRFLAALALLRIPAASAVGLLVVSGLDGAWLIADVSVGLSLGLLLMPVFYLLIEVSSHGIGDLCEIARRALVVLCIVFAHSAALSLIVLAWFGPALSASMSATDAASLDGRVIAALMLKLAALASAVGVFSQILWDERPITAPLAHASWKFNDEEVDW